MTKDLRLAIRQNLADLPKSEQKIGHFVLANPLEVIKMNATELATAAGSSSAGVIRFCHSIGLSGFTDLKISLSAQASQWTDVQYTDILPDESLAKIKEKFANNTAIVFADTNSALIDQDVERVTDILLESPVIYLYGLGASYIVAQDFRQKFTRIGKQVVVSQDQHELAAAMAIAPKGSTYIGISNSGEKLEGLMMMSVAKKWALTTISLTKATENKLANQADIALYTAKTKEALLRSGATISLLSQLYAIDILFFSFMTKNYDSHIHNLELSKQATEDIDHFNH